MIGACVGSVVGINEESGGVGFVAGVIEGDFVLPDTSVGFELGAPDGDPEAGIVVGSDVGLGVVDGDSEGFVDGMVVFVMHLSNHDPKLSLLSKIISPDINKDLAMIDD